MSGDVPFSWSLLEARHLLNLDDRHLTRALSGAAIAHAYSHTQLAMATQVDGRVIHRHLRETAEALATLRTLHKGGAHAADILAATRQRLARIAATDVVPDGPLVCLVLQPPRQFPSTLISRSIGGFDEEQASYAIDGWQR